MELRKFQKKAKSIIIDRLTNNVSEGAVFIMPPGSGKTAIIAHTVVESINKQLVKQVLIIVPAKVLVDYLTKKISELNASDGERIAIMTVHKVVSLIESKKVGSNDFDLIVFDEVNNASKSTVCAYKFFNGFKWGLSAIKTDGVLELFKKSYTSIDFELKFDLKSNDPNNNILNHEADDYRDLLVNTIKASLESSEVDSIEHNYFKKEYIESLEFIVEQGIKVDGLRDLVNRKKQLEKFEKLLNDEDFFKDHLLTNVKPESVWQNFFENNTWIFGLSFNFLFNSSLQDEKLEQVVEGYSVKGAGKRVDALMRSRGVISSLCFAEIKTHKKELLRANRTAYRPESWAISDELSGGIAQVQKTVHKSVYNINSSLKLKDANGFSTGENLYLIKPKSFLLIGSLEEFRNDKGHVQEDKFISFELFRRSISDVEIITFDELYERAVAVIGLF